MARSAAVKAPSANGNGTSQVIPSVDVIGPEGRAQVVQRMLAPWQAERYELSVIQTSSGLSDGDLVPGLPAGAEGVPTFAERRRMIEEVEQSILGSVEPLILERIRALVDSQAQ